MRTQPLPENDGNTQPIEVLADGLRHPREATEGAPRAEKKSFQERVREFEHGIIAEALEEAGGGVTKAARALGLTHQGLCYIINHRHKDLLAVRTPIRIRRRSIIPKNKLRRSKQTASKHVYEGPPS